MRMMKTKNWKQRAEALFFIEGKNITEISKLIGVSVRSISKHFNKLPAYHYEKRQRNIADLNRREYFREYKREKRAAAVDYTINKYTMRNEHENAVRILSRERFTT